MQGELSKEIAAGVYLRQRRDSLSALHLLLKLPAHGLSESDELAAFVQELVQVPGFFGRLCTVITDRSLLPAEGSQLSHVINERRARESRRDLALLERTRLCECVFFLCKRFGNHVAQDKERVKAVADLLAGTVAAAQGVSDESTRLAMAHHCILASLALLALLLSEAEADRVPPGIEAAAREAAIPAALKAITAQGLAGVSQLALGILQLAAGRVDDSAAALREARQQRVFTFLRVHVVESLLFRDDVPRQQELYGEVLQGAVVRVLYTPMMDETINDAGNDEEDVRWGTAAAAGRFCEHFSLAPDALLLVRSLPHRPLMAGAAHPMPKDSIADVLSLLAAVFPYLGPERRLKCFEDLAFSGEGATTYQRAWGQRVADDCTAVPEVFVALVRLLVAVAEGDEDCAGRIYDLLRKPLGRVGICWPQIFTVLYQVAARLSAQRGEPLHPEDVKGFTALLALLRAVLEALRGHDRRIAGIFDICRERCGYDVAQLLLALLNYPTVPNLHDFRAGLVRCLAALVGSRDQALVLLQQLQDPTAVLGVASAAPLLRAVQYQLSDAEARMGSYPETLAFLELVNRLLELTVPRPGLLGAADVRRSVSSLGQDIAAFLPYTQFIREVVLGQLGQREYRDLAHKWRLAELGFRHLELALEGLEAAMAGAGVEAVVQASSGSAALQDLLACGPAMACCMQVLQVGIDPLITERQRSLWGASFEGAVHSALRLLARGLEVDRAYLDATRRVEARRTLDVVLLTEWRRLHSLLDFVRYPFHEGIQEQGVRITLALAERTSRLVPILLQPGQPLAHLVDGFASCLQESIFKPRRAVPLVGEDGDAELEQQAVPAMVMVDEDDRAALILELLLRTVNQPAPSLAHLLLGYDVDAGGVEVGFLDTSREFSCLSVILEFLTAHGGRPAQGKPEVYEQCLELLCRLCSSPQTSATTLDSLCAPPHGLLVGCLGPLLQDSGRAVSRTSPAAVLVPALRQRAWLLKVFALGLLRRDILQDDLAAAGSEAPCDARRVLAALFGIGPDASLAGLEPSGIPLLALLQQVTAPKEPSTEAFLSESSRALLRQLRLEGVLSAPAAASPEEARLLEAQGILLPSPRGYHLLDPEGISAAVFRRAEAAGVPALASSLEVAAGEAAGYALVYNGFVEVLSAQELLVQGLQECLEVAVRLRMDSLVAASQETAQAAGGMDKLFARLLTSLLRKVQGTLDRPDLCLSWLVAHPLPPSRASPLPASLPCSIDQELVPEGPGAACGPPLLCPGHLPGPDEGVFCHRSAASTRRS